MSPLKRKAHISRLSSESLKRLRLRLDPAPSTEDSTIIEYHKRVQILLPEDRDKLHICIPFEKELGRIREKMDRLQQENNEAQGKINEAQEKINEAQQTNNVAQQRRMVMLQANALIDLARLIMKKCKVGPSDDHSTTRLQQFVANISDTQLTELNIPRKVWPLLRKLDKFIAQRNIAAHETKGAFAQLLLSNEFHNTHVLELWKDVFPVLYGASVQDLAASEEAELAELLALSM